jgi:uncharacterized protein
VRRKHLKTSIDVTQLLREPVGSSQSLDINGLLRDDIDGCIEGTAKLIRTGRGVLVQCELNAEAKLICSRCLEAFSCPMSFTAEEEFLPVADLSDDSSVSSPEQSEGFTIDDRKTVDLGELIRQYVLLNLPMKPLCRPDCPGIKEGNSNATTA